MKKTIKIGFLLVLITTLLCACGPSKQKIASAQEKYKELVSINNQVVRAYSEIKDSSLDEALPALTERVREFEQFNLNELTDEQIDELVKNMQDLIDAYSDYRKTIGEIKITEDASVLTQHTFSLVNNTDYRFVSLTLMERGETDLVTNVLDNTDGLAPGQEMMGLSVYVDVDETPWILTLVTQEDENENKESYNFTLDMEKISADNAILEIKCDEETGKVYLE